LVAKKRNPSSRKVQNSSRILRQLEPATQETPEQAFERRWVEALLEDVLLRLRAECAAYGQADRFDVLKIFLVEDKGPVSFAEIGAKLNMTEAAVKGAVRRLRARYRELFREEVANTVDKPDQAATPGSAVAAVYDQYVFSVLSKDPSPLNGERVG
jgi:RNA polymerase sigma-70 factor (ECF subfamily)